MMCNDTGVALANVTIPLVLVTMTDSESVAASGLAIFSATAILSEILSGTIVDKFRPDRTLRVVSLALSLTVLLLTACIATKQTHIIIIFAILGVIGCLTSIPFPSEHALIKQAVTEEQYGEAASVSQARETIADIIGTSAAPVMVNIFAWLPFLVQSICHGLAGLFAPKILSQPVGSGDETDTDGAQSESFLSSCTKGFKIVFTNPSLRGITVIAAIANMAMPMVPLAMILYFHGQNVSGFQIGIFAASFGVGVIIGSPVAGKLTSTTRLGALGIMALSAYAIGTLLLIVVHDHYVLACIIYLLSGIPLPAFNSAIAAYTTAVTPEDVMGRVSSASALPGMCLQPVGLVLTGVLLTRTDINTTLLVSVVLSGISVVVMLISTSVRTIPAVNEISEIEL